MVTHVSGMIDFRKKRCRGFSGSKLGPLATPIMGISAVKTKGAKAGTRADDSQHRRATTS